MNLYSSGKLIFGGIHLYLPLREVGITHKHGFVRVPLSEYRLVSADAQAMVTVYAGCVCLYQQPLLVSFGCGVAFAVCQKRFRKGGSIEILLLRQVFPSNPVSGTFSWKFRKG